MNPDTKQTALQVTGISAGIGALLAVGILFSPDVINPPQPAALVAPTNAPRGQSITLEWDRPAIYQSFRLYASSNKVDWRVVAETTDRFATVTNIFLPQWFVCRTVTGEDESDDSNRLGWLRDDQIILVTAEASGDLNTWSNYALIFQGTNVPGMKFFRTRAELRTQRVIE